MKSKNLILSSIVGISLLGSVLSAQVLSSSEINNRPSFSVSAPPVHTSAAENDVRNIENEDIVFNDFVTEQFDMNKLPDYLITKKEYKDIVSTWEPDDRDVLIPNVTKLEGSDFSNLFNEVIPGLSFENSACSAVLGGSDNMSGIDIYAPTNFALESDTSFSFSPTPYEDTDFTMAYFADDDDEGTPFSAPSGESDRIFVDVKTGKISFESPTLQGLFAPHSDEFDPLWILTCYPLSNGLFPVRMPPLNISCMAQNVFYNFALDDFTTTSAQTADSLSKEIGFLDSRDNFETVGQFIRNNFESRDNAPTSYDTTNLHFFSDNSGSSEIIDFSQRITSGNFFIELSSNGVSSTVVGESPILELHLPFVNNISLSQTDNSLDINFDTENIVGLYDLNNAFRNFEVIFDCLTTGETFSSSWGNLDITTSGDNVNLHFENFIFPEDRNIDYNISFFPFGRSTESGSLSEKKFVFSYLLPKLSASLPTFDIINSVADSPYTAILDINIDVPSPDVNRYASFINSLVITDSDGTVVKDLSFDYPNYNEGGTFHFELDSLKPETTYKGYSLVLSGSTEDEKVWSSEVIIPSFTTPSSFALPVISLTDPFNIESDSVTFKIEVSDVSSAGFEPNIENVSVKNYDDEKINFSISEKFTESFFGEHDLTFEGLSPYTGYSGYYLSFDVSSASGEHAIEEVPMKSFVSKKSGAVNPILNINLGADVSPTSKTINFDVGNNFVETRYSSYITSMSVVNSFDPSINVDLLSDADLGSSGGSFSKTFSGLSPNTLYENYYVSMSGVTEDGDYWSTATDIPAFATPKSASEIPLLTLNLDETTDTTQDVRFSISNPNDPNAYGSFVDSIVIKRDSDRSVSLDVSSDYTDGEFEEFTETLSGLEPNHLYNDFYVEFSTSYDDSPDSVTRYEIPDFTTNKKAAVAPVITDFERVFYTEDFSRFTYSIANEHDEDTYISKLSDISFTQNGSLLEPIWDSASETGLENGKHFFDVKGLDSQTSGSVELNLDFKRENSKDFGEVETVYSSTTYVPIVPLNPNEIDNDSLFVVKDGVVSLNTESEKYRRRYNLVEDSLMFKEPKAGTYEFEFKWIPVDGVDIVDPESNLGSVKVMTDKGEFTATVENLTNSNSTRKGASEDDDWNWYNVTLNGLKPSESYYLEWFEVNFENSMTAEQFELNLQVDTKAYESAVIPSESHEQKMTINADGSADIFLALDADGEYGLIEDYSLDTLSESELFFDDEKVSSDLVSDARISSSEIISDVNSYQFHVDKVPPNSNFNNVKLLLGTTSTTTSSPENIPILLDLTIDDNYTEVIVGKVSHLKWLFISFVALSCLPFTVYFVMRSRMKKPKFDPDAEL